LHPRLTVGHLLALLVLLLLGAFVVGYVVGRDAD
jgi:hypothetical protein